MCLCQSCLPPCRPLASGAFVLLDSSVLQGLRLQRCIVTIFHGNGWLGRGGICYGDGKMRGSIIRFALPKTRWLSAASLVFCLFPAILLVPFFRFARTHAWSWRILVLWPILRLGMDCSDLGLGCLGGSTSQSLGHFGGAVGQQCWDMWRPSFHTELLRGSLGRRVCWRSRIQVACLTTT